jgi:hypothetical protein
MAPIVLTVQDGAVVNAVPKVNVAVVAAPTERLGLLSTWMPFSRVPAWVLFIRTEPSGPGLISANVAIVFPTAPAITPVFVTVRVAVPAPAVTRPLIVLVPSTMTMGVLLKDMK